MRVKNRTCFFPMEEISQILLCFLVSLLTSNTIQFPRCEKKCSHMFTMQRERSFLASYLTFVRTDTLLIKEKHHEKNALSLQIMVL